MTLDDLRSILLMKIIPNAYSPIIGIAINHIVTPLPSGVISAPNIAIITIAYLKFLLQNLESNKPANDNPYIITGNWNANPNPIMNWSANVMKSLIVTNVSAPTDSPYL